MSNPAQSPMSESTIKKLNTQGSRYLSFSLGNERFAIPLLSVKEVIAIPEVTPIPFTPAHFKGIMNLRGQVISIIDLRQKMNIKSQPTAESAVVICDLSPLCLGVIVDSVDSVLSLEENEIKPRPDIESKQNVDYIIGVVEREKRLVLLLEIARALSVDDMRSIASQKQKAA